MPNPPRKLVKYKGFVIIVATEDCFISVLWNLRMLFARSDITNLLYMCWDGHNILLKTISYINSIIQYYCVYL